MTGTDDSGETVLDLRGLLCPIPVARTAERVASGRAGERLRLLCTDPGARDDIPIWARVHGHAIESVLEADGLVVVRLRIGSGTEAPGP